MMIWAKLSGEKDTHMQLNERFRKVSTDTPAKGLSISVISIQLGGKPSDTPKTDGPLEVPIEARPTDKFSMGKVIATMAVREKVCPFCAGEALKAHASGNWGEVSQWDALANEDALKNGGRILSTYICGGGGKFYVITSADRSLTTVCLPEEL